VIAKWPSTRGNIIEKGMLNRFQFATFSSDEPHLDTSAYAQATQGSLDEAMITTKLDESESLKMKV